MKKLFTFFFLLTASILVAQELTAEAIAVEPPILDQIIKGLFVALMSFLGYLSTALVPLINAYLKNIMHFRGSSVVADALTQAFGELLTEAKLAFADGKISPEEIATLKARAKAIAESKLKNLSGFYKKDLMGWLDEVIDVEMGKLLSRIFA